MLATRAANKAALPRGVEWCYEVKWDGVRALADTTTGAVRLHARSGRDITRAYPELGGLAALPRAVVDGEIVVLAAGVPSFEALAERMHVRDGARARLLAARSPVTFVAFDLLVLDGVDLTRRPLDERRAALEALDWPERTQLSPTYPDLDPLWDVTLEHGLEGVLAKRRTSTYQPGRRSPDWVKAAHRGTRVAAVVGWRPEGTNEAGRSAVAGAGPLGAVLLAAPDATGAWRYLGKAGSGLGGRRGADLERALRGLVRPDAPLLDPVPAADARGVTWVEPRVGVDVAYLQRTRSGRLRQPTVRALRTEVPIDPWESP
ncbi:ATP-dependent DNA ligase [Actinotalea fermentans]|nr:DNA ligase [Actinotalea fermentans]